ncbi:hypothetical protein LOK49_LG04G02184 [Camellia lanceoleosa]|uniref:Uncharacterized protein n=1 Tax=Camellia lanceoleosa TaxID=1840588 RepID=A0ACC0HYI6_9ERIC|nr:hypothetical protein LOK49_LG04G02184 [Camellia lanceoleosa]
MCLVCCLCLCYFCFAAELASGLLCSALSAVVPWCVLQIAVVGCFGLQIGVDGQLLSYGGLGCAWEGLCSVCCCALCVCVCFVHLCCAALSAAILLLCCSAVESMPA